MPLPISIPDLISQRIVENARIEYKSDWNPERILHTICAFANDIDNWGGGYIVIGIDEEDGMPVKPVKGIEKASIDRINKEILQTCNLIEPRYIPIVEETSYEGKEIIVIWVPGGEDRPYKCPISLSGQKSAKAYYIRKVSSTIKANGQDEKELFSLASKQPYDDRLNLNAEIGDLKSSLISEFLYNVGSDLYEASLSQPVSETGSAMQIIRGPKEMRKPINAGLMFFNN
ncbi:MAG: ATP-binding protein, partial [Spirochaetes bacterium]|nr:ATP-binding protein [Candidatus Ornithospirochaeta stercoravium]